MLGLWLGIAVIITGFVTFKCFTEGFNRWGFMYVFAILALLMYLMKRFMIKRYEKHMKYLEEQEKSGKSQ